MPVVHDTIPQFFNGVSQQAPQLRRTSQVSEQINCFSSISDGVLPRPPVEHLSLLSSSSLGNVYLHTINRDATERFVVIVKNGDIDVYDLDGNAMTVTFPAGTGYLTSSDPRNDFECYTVKDYTFILNKTVTTAMTSRSAGTIDGTVQNFSDLSDEAETDSAGVVWKIEGNSDTGFGSYYVEKTEENAGSTGDVYTEIVDPRVTQVSLDASTMPHELVKTGATTFEFREVTWIDKQAGDDVTNPSPPFVGQTINDLFIYRNRFGFLSGDNVSLSEAGAANFFNFFRTTVTQLLDSDTIHVSANNTRVADLKFAVAFTDSLTLWSEQTQFEMGAGDLLTPSTVEILPTTQFVTSTKCRPKLAGRNIYFAVERTEHTGIREYFIESDSGVNDAADVTKHVPRYIPKDVSLILPSSNDDVLFVLSDEDKSKIWVYQWFWAQQSGGLNKLQSAWHLWDMGTDAEVLSIDLIDNQLYIIVERDSKTYLETLDLTTRKFDTDLPFQIRLDRRSSLTGVYDGTNTTWTLPFATDDDVTVVRDGGFTVDAGLEILNLTQPTTTTVVAPGDWSESACVVGVEYDKSFTLSPIYIKKATGSGGTVSRLGGRLQLRKIKFSYSDTVLFTVSVTPKSRSSYTRTFTAPIGSDEAVIGAVVPRDGVYSVPVVSEASTTTIQVSSSSYLPFAITSAEWEGLFNANAR